MRARVAARGTLSFKPGVESGAFRTIAERNGLSFKQAIALSPEQLQAMQDRAEANSGAAQPDLAGIIAVEAPRASSEELARLGREFQALDLVEYVHLEPQAVPPPSPAPPPAPR